MAPPRHLICPLWRTRLAIWSARYSGSRKTPVPRPRRNGVVFSRWIIAERLVRALVIVEALEVLEALELLAQRARRRIGRVLQQSQVQPLEAAVLLRLCRFNPLPRHAPPDHPHRQPRQ